MGEFERCPDCHTLFCSSAPLYFVSLATFLKLISVKAVKTPQPLQVSSFWPQGCAAYATGLP
jgi:hypothetical protein